MRMPSPTEQDMHRSNIEDARSRAYASVCPPLNRAERRTAHGRMLVAQAEAAAMRAELEYLRSLHGVTEKGSAA